MGFFDKRRQDKTGSSKPLLDAAAPAPGTTYGAPDHKGNKTDQLEETLKKLIETFKQEQEKRPIDFNVLTLYKTYVVVLTACLNALIANKGGAKSELAEFTNGELAKIANNECIKLQNPHEISCFEKPDFREIEKRNAGLFSRPEKRSEVSDRMLETLEALGIKIDLPANVQSPLHPK